MTIIKANINDFEALLDLHLQIEDYVISLGTLKEQNCFR